MDIKEFEQRMLDFSIVRRDVPKKGFEGWELEFYSSELKLSEMEFKCLLQQYLNGKGYGRRFKKRQKIKEEE